MPQILTSHQRQLVKALFAGSMSAEERRFLLMRYSDGFTYDELAVALEITPHDARRLHVRLLGRVRAVLEGRQPTGARQMAVFRLKRNVQTALGSIPEGTFFVLDAPRIMPISDVVRAFANGCVEQVHPDPMLPVLSAFEREAKELLVGD